MGNCNEAIACLRNTQRLYYFWELLGEREKLYEHFEQKNSAECENTHKQIYAIMQERNALWKRTLEAMYQDCGVSPEMKSSCIRVETTTGKMQMPIARQILRRLGLSAEKQRVDVVASNPEALKLVKDIATYGYNREYGKEQEALEMLEKMRVRKCRRL